jgi:hypothetical protein
MKVEEIIETKENLEFYTTMVELPKGCVTK